MATLVKTGIGDGQTLTPVHITELYDAFTGDKLFDNIIINNTMKVTHDGKVAIGTTTLDTPHQFNVQGTLEADIGRFTELIVTTQSFVTSSTLVISGSNTFGTVATDLHIFTGSLRVSGSENFDNFFLNNVAIGKIENTHNIFEVQGSGTFSNAITASDITVSNTGSFSHLSVSGDAVIEGNLTFGNAPTDNISFAADIDSDFIPDDNSTFNLGSFNQQWNKLFITDIQANSLAVTSSVLTIDSVGNISSSLSSTGSFGSLFSANDLNVSSNTNLNGNVSIGGTLDITGVLSASGDVHFANTASFGFLSVSDTLNINTASIDNLNVGNITINNLTGSLDKVLVNDSDGNLTFDFADRTSIVGQNTSGITITAGTPIVVTSYISDNIYGIETARNDLEARSPAIGIVQKDISSGGTGDVILSGLVRSSDLDTSGFSVGDDLFLGVSALQNTKPTGAGVEIQLIGSVLKSSATNGEILLLSGGGGGSLEVLSIDHIFIGSGSLTENLHLSGALNRSTLDNVTATGTGSFAHLIGDGSGLSNVFEDTVPSASISTRITKNEQTGSNIITGQVEFTNITASNNISSSLSSTASFGLLNLSGIEINTDGVSRDQVLKFNGTNFVPAAPDATFVFTIADFDTNDGTTPQLIGTGSWKAAGDLTFTAVYNNGPPDGHSGASEGAPKITSIIDGSTSGSDMFPLSSSFTTGTNNRAIMFPPNSSDDIRFRLFASAGSDTDNEFSDQRIFFFNQFVFGDSSKSGSFNQNDISALAAANTITTNDTTRTISVSIGASNYLNFAHRTGDTNVAQVYCGNNPNRLTVAMDITDATTITPKKETVSYLNTAGKTENFFVYSSKNQNIDAHSSTFITTTSTQPKNYIYFGTGSSWTNNETNVEALTNKTTTLDDGSITGNTLSIGTFTDKFVIVAIPNRYGDNEVNYQFKDNSTNLPFDFTQQSDVTVVNAVGFQEDYSVYRSTNLLTMTNATVLIDTV